jgi:hypothetical protein
MPNRQSATQRDDSAPTDPFLAAFRGSFTSALRWSDLDALWRREHDERLCGIVYADDLRIPSLVKIYDPNNLGVSCGFSSNPPLPGWVMSKLPPVDLPATQLVPKARRRWWQGLFGNAAHA